MFKGCIRMSDVIPLYILIYFANHNWIVFSATCKFLFTNTHQNMNCKAKDMYHRTTLPTQLVQKQHNKIFRCTKILNYIWYLSLMCTEFYFIVRYILQQVVNCWLDTATRKEQWKQHVRINNNLLYSTCF
jgi:hypothetical protein